MDNELDLPPYQSLPADVRDRIRARVLDGSGKPLARPVIKMVPILAAAAAIVLVASGAVVAGSVRNEAGLVPAGASGSVAPPPPVQSGSETQDTVSAQDADRCWAATRKTAHPDRYPDQSTWQPMLSVTKQPGFRTVAFSTQVEPVFCTLTQTSVFLSDPSTVPQPSAQAGIQLRYAIPGVILAGTRSLNNSRVAMRATAAGKQSYTEDDATLVAGLFVFGPSGWNSGDKIDFKDSETNETLPSVQGFGYTTVVDNPQPKGERGSPAGQRMAKCMTNLVAGAVPDADYWQPGALVQLADGTSLVTSRFGTLLGDCPHYAGSSDAPFQVVNYAPLADGLTWKAYGVSVEQSPADGTLKSVILWGPIQSPAAKITFTAPDGAEAATTPVNGTFAVNLPLRRQENANARIGVTVRDAAGTIIYQNSFVA